MHVFFFLFVTFKIYFKDCFNDVMTCVWKYEPFNVKNRNDISLFYRAGLLAVMLVTKELEKRNRAGC